MSEKKNILLTGATGFIGSHLLHEMLNTAEIGTLYVVCRKTDPAQERQRIIDAYLKFAISDGAEVRRATNLRIIDGDITLPRLGFSDAVYAELSETVDVIHHIAARVNHVRPYDVLKGANVDSVADLIALARSGKDKVLNFVSTLGSAVRKDDAGMYVEDFPATEALQSDMGYLLSKWEAEKLLADYHRQGGRTNIFRLGYISGHSETGAALFADNQFMLFIKSCIELGYAPELNRLINFTPVDFTARIMNLPVYMREGGHVLNLFNATELIYWHEIVAWLVARGYAIETLPFYAWQQKLLQSGPGNPLQRFLSLYGVDGAHEKILRFGREIHLFNTGVINEVTRTSKVVPPRLKFDLLDKYLGYLQAQGFLDMPAVPAVPAQVPAPGVTA
ncbi:MAG TPA: thioester reductase domain-containing protein [Burkholderiaceae bacterium]|nr:thioester reductase domain-containing protein [Burkholderiaceae bacterium]